MDGNSKSIMKHGLPPVLRNGCSSTYATSNHDPAELIIKNWPYKIVKEEIAIDDHSSSPLWLKHLRKNLTWSSENFLASYVREVLEDIFWEVGMTALTCCSELSLFDAQKMDVVLVCQFGVPIGVVEVKKPGSSLTKSLDDEQVIGQIFDYLCHIKTYMGRRHPFGILTSYYDWRIVWLQDSDEFASTPTSYNCTELNVRGPVTNVSIDVQDWSDDIPESTPYPHNQSSESTVPERKLIGTPLIKQSNSDLPYLIVSAILKMASSPVDYINFLASPGDNNRSYICVREESWSWEKFDGVFDLRYSRCLPRFKKVFLLSDLGGGGDGRVWLAATMKGEAFVIKFSQDKTSLEQEANIWKEVWKCDAQVKRLNGCYGLAMPWVKPCTEDEFENKEIRSAIEEAVKTLATAGYIHEDLKHRHVGLYKKDSRYKVVLFDLAHVSRIEEQTFENSIVLNQ